MSEEKKQTQKSVFFLVGANFILSEDLSNIEYSESALKESTHLNQHIQSVSKETHI